MKLVVNQLLHTHKSGKEATIDEVRKRQYVEQLHRLVPQRITLWVKTAVQK
jgi:hypothetical protein